MYSVGLKPTTLTSTLLLQGGVSFELEFNVTHAHNIVISLH